MTKFKVEVFNGYTDFAKGKMVKMLKMMHKDTFIAMFAIKKDLHSNEITIDNLKSVNASFDKIKLEVFLHKKRKKLFNTKNEATIFSFKRLKWFKL
jgi:hypothetical protein